MDASVIVPTYRGERRIRALLEALAAQDFDGAWEVVVSMDGVSDDTRSVVEEYTDRLDVRCIASAEPRGVARTLNDGFGVARGWVLIRCDDDFTPAPDMVRRHVGWHRKLPRAGVSCAYRDVEVATPYGRAYGVEAGRRRREQWYARRPEDRWIDWAGHNSVTRQVWEEVGGFDPRFRYGQDSELGWRLNSIGVTIVVDPELEIEHRGAPVAAVNRVPRAFVAGASRRQFALVHGVSHSDADTDTTPGSLQRAWNVATLATSTLFRSEAQYRGIGAVVDVVLRVVPAPVGRRVAAWAIESAARAGERFGPNSLEHFAQQKDREIDTEQAQASDRG